MADKDVTTVEDLAGVPEGAEVITSGGHSTGEVVVAEKDENGNVTGWHKAPKSK